MCQHLNIVAFDVPDPPDYGGVIDVFYKIKWLQQQGVKVHLHCFNKNRTPSAQLESLCEEVFYYPRKTFWWKNLSVLPYTVLSRRNEALKINLLKNEYPILFEVLHTCFLLNDPQLAHRKKLFRHSNIEHIYYARLAASEKNFFRKIFHYLEALKLKRYENVINAADLILAVNLSDLNYFRQKYKNVKAKYLPSFHASDEVVINSGCGDYVLVHGNFSVSENYQAVVWLIDHVLGHLQLRTVVAGKQPPLFLQTLVKKHKHIELIADPGQEEMDLLVRDAQVHLLYTAQATGLKLKMLNVLYRGRYVVCNDKMLAGTRIQENDGLFVANKPGDFVQKIRSLMQAPFTEDLVQQRKQMLSDFDNFSNVQRLINWCGVLEKH